MAEHEGRLDQYKKWILSYTNSLSPEARVSLFSQLMSVSDFDDVNAKDIVGRFGFKHRKHDGSTLTRMVLHRHLIFSSSKNGIIQPSHVTDEERTYINTQKNAILYTLMKSSIDELVVSSIDTETKSIQKQNYSLARKWKLLKRLSIVKKRITSSVKKRTAAVNWFYLVIFGLLSLVVGYIVYLGWAEKPTVNIEFNVGEIIGGILVGAGALLAGGAYAVKTLREGNNHER